MLTTEPQQLQIFIYKHKSISGPVHQGKHFALIDRSGWKQKMGGSVFLDVRVCRPVRKYHLKEERGAAERKEIEKS